MVDGVEGYVYPDSLTPQPGMVRLLRRYSATRDDHAIFPESELAAMEVQGYTQIINYRSSLGWVYPNNGGRPSY